jgi:two-component sensor histidine kinase
MDIEETREARERKTFSAAIEELLEKERTYRQNNEYNASATILPQIVIETDTDRTRLRHRDARRRLRAAAAADQEAWTAGEGSGGDGAQGDDLLGHGG